MFVIGNFIGGIALVLNIVLNMTMWVIIINALVTWVNPDPYNPIVRTLHSITEPILRPIRRRLPAYSLGVDISPVIAVLIIIFLQFFLVHSLEQLGRNLR